MDFFSSVEGGDILLAISVFGAILFGALAVVSWWNEVRSRPLERLERFTRGGNAAVADDPKHEWLKRRLDELVDKAGPALAKPLMPKDEVGQSEIKTRLSAAGIRGERAVVIYLTIKGLVCVAGAALMAVLGSSLPIIGAQPWLTRALVGLGIGMFACDLVVKQLAKRRQEAIFCGLPDALDLLVVCVESGLGLDAALKRVAREIRRSCPVLAQEFEIATMQLQMGQPRSEVLRDLGLRNDVDDLRALAATLIQADRFGTSIAQALRVHSDAMRTRRRQLAEERAQKTTVKLLIPLILFIFPGIFVVLVGPAAIMIMRNLVTQ